ncbi:hypothetical protein [Methylocella silvestris]|uniref:hypothetical protein n=1 Tax=Methylocella silvestris TaxID=199596 RepID=UPI00059DDF30|nr:hypothetical protein [Methylocella silvestris]
MLTGGNPGRRQARRRRRPSDERHVARRRDAIEGGALRFFFGRASGDIARKADLLVFGLHVLAADVAYGMTFDEIDMIFHRACAYLEKRK